MKVKLIVVVLCCWGFLLLAIGSVVGVENCGRVAPTIKRYIFGGKSSIIEQWPWQIHLKILDGHVSIVDNNHVNCGGTIIDDYWILTAAHCFTGNKNPKIFLLNGHNYTVNENYRMIKHEKVIIHPEYSEFSGSHEYSTNDIALVKLTDSYKFDKATARPCLPRQDAYIPPNTICYITGFGATNKDDNHLIKRIKEGRVAIKHEKICTKTLQLEYYDTKTMICAGRTKDSKANSCQGDSGGPLVCEGWFEHSPAPQWFIFGITSFGALDCSVYTSSVYTRVSTYTSWILEHVQPQQS